MTVNRKRCGLCQAPNREELESALETGQASCDELDTIHNWRSGTAAQHQRNHMGEYKSSMCSMHRPNEETLRTSVKRR